jgi:hypothetical protein
LHQEGKELLSGRLDTQGKFVFPLPRQEKLVIQVEQGKGHGGEFSLQIQ